MNHASRTRALTMLGCVWCVVIMTSSSCASWHHAWFVCVGLSRSPITHCAQDMVPDLMSVQASQDFPLPLQHYEELSAQQNINAKHNLLALCLDVRAVSFAGGGPIYMPYIMPLLDQDGRRVVELSFSIACPNLKRMSYLDIYLQPHSHSSGEPNACVSP
jgi:hypothetical protein